MTHRHAIYVAPARGSDLMRLAGGWLGRDAFGDRPRPQPDVAGIAELTAAPRRYGFHGTLVAPFRLHRDRMEDELRSALGAFALSRRAIPLPLAVGRLGPFFALVPRRDAPALNDLADRAVETFHPFRAPLTDEDRARRNPEGLTQQQRDHLDRWHYPYVFDEFRFHMTLTGPVPEGDRDRVEQAIRDHFDAGVLEGFAVDGIARYAEPEPAGDFRIRERYALGGAP